MDGAGAGQKPVDAASPRAQVRKQVVIMDNSMLMDRRVRRASAVVLLAAYIVILIAGFVGMLWTDPPDHYQSYSKWITAVETTEQDPFPTAGIIRYIYNIEGTVHKLTLRFNEAQLYNSIQDEMCFHIS